MENVLRVAREIATREAAYGETLYALFGAIPPGETLLKKLGFSGFAILREIYSDPFVYGVINNRKGGVLKLDWNVIGDGNDEVLGWLVKLDVEELIKDILDAPFLGYQVFEIFWEDYVPIRVQKKKQEWFLFSVDGKLLFRSKANPNGEEVPEQKFLVARYNDTIDEVYGQSVLARCYWYWLFAKSAVKSWVKYVEKFGIPKIVAEVPGADNVHEKLGESLRGMVQDAVIVTNPGVKIDVLKSDLGSASDGGVFATLINFCREAISTAILGHAKVAESVPGQLGNQLLAMNIRKDIIDADKRLVEKVINRLIKYYWDFHHTDQEQPYFVLVEQGDLQLERAKRDQILAQIGVPFSAQYWKKQYNLSDEDVLFEAVNFGSVEDYKAMQDLVIEKNGSLLESSALKVLDFINGQADYSQAINGLKELYPKLDDREIYKRLEKMFALSFVLGARTVEDESGG